MATGIVKGFHPRILFVGPMLGNHPGWVPAPAEELAPRLVERGYACKLTSPLLNRYKRFIDILSTIIRHHRKFDILCLQVYSGPSFFVDDLASWLARLLGMRLVLVLHGGGLPEFVRRFPHWSRRVFNRAHRIVSPSNFICDSLTQYGFRPTIIPNAIQIENYPYRWRNNIKPHVLWMRTFHEIYNPEMAVDTLEKLVLDFPDATLTMAGQEKGNLDLVKKLVKKKHLESRVRFVGFLDTNGKQRQFALHDIFINTNRVDNMPISLIEASAFGMPIVATDVGGVPYIIHDSENGLLIRNEDSSDMALAIRRLLNDPELTGNLSQNARCMAEQYDWSVVLPQWERLFLEIAEKRIKNCG